MGNLTAGEECQIAAKSFSSFSGHIPSILVKECMGMAILKGTDGVSVIRLPSGEWSAPCAISLESVSNTISAQQETVLLFMSEVAIYSLVTRANVALNQTHRFEPGPFGTVKSNEGIDIYVYVRFNGGFTPSDLIAGNMVGWIVKEDTVRHTKWHGDSVTWFDVLTNKISVDRSSVGNALYVVLNLGAGSAVDQSRYPKKNYADVESWVNVAPSFKKSAPVPVQQPVQNQNMNMQNSQYNTFQNPEMNQSYVNQSPYQFPPQHYQSQSTYQSGQNPAPMYMYGQSQPGYGQSQPGYGQPLQSQPPPVFGQPPPVFGQPPPVYGQPQPGYGQPQSGYGQSQAGSGQQNQGYMQGQDFNAQGFGQGYNG